MSVPHNWRDRDAPELAALLEEDDAASLCYEATECAIAELWHVGGGGSVQREEQREQAHFRSLRVIKILDHYSRPGFKVADYESGRNFGLSVKHTFRNPVAPGGAATRRHPAGVRFLFLCPARRLPSFTSGPSVAGCPVATLRLKRLSRACRAATGRQRGFERGTALK